MEQNNEIERLPGEEQYHQAIAHCLKGNIKAAKTSFKQAAKQDFLAADLWLYSLDGENEGQREKAEQAYGWLLAQDGKDGENKKRAWVQSDLGFCYEEGVGCEKNLAEAIKYYEKAVQANPNHWPALVNLREHYLQGEGKNLKKAFEYAKRAADLGHLDSTYYAAYYLEEIIKENRARPPRAILKRAINQEQKTTSIEEDLAKTFEYYKLAADQGHADAQYRLGIWFEKGEAPLKKENFEEAFKYYKLAADQGHTEAQYRAGWYKEGRGVSIDIMQAMYYFHLAAQEGHEAAQEEAATMLVIDDTPYEKNFSRVLENLRVLKNLGTPFDLKLEKVKQARALVANARYMQGSVIKEKDIQQIENTNDSVSKLDAELRKEAGEPFIGVLAAINECKQKTFKWRFYCIQNDREQPRENLTLQANLIAGLCHSRGISGCEKDNARAIGYYKAAWDQARKNKVAAPVLNDALVAFAERASKSTLKVNPIPQLDPYPAIANALLCDLWRDYRKIRKTDREEIFFQAEVNTLNAKELALETLMLGLSRNLADYLKAPSKRSKENFLSLLVNANRNDLLGGETTGWQIAFNVAISFTVIGLIVVLAHRYWAGRWGLWNNGFADKFEGLEQAVQRIVPESILLSSKKQILKADQKVTSEESSTLSTTLSKDEDTYHDVPPSSYVLTPSSLPSGILPKTDSEGKSFNEGRVLGKGVQLPSKASGGEGGQPKYVVPPPPSDTPLPPRHLLGNPPSYPPPSLPIAGGGPPPAYDPQPPPVVDVPTSNPTSLPEVNETSPGSQASSTGTPK